MTKLTSYFHTKDKGFWYIFIIALSLRLVLALVNTEMNDDHVTPILLWISSGSYPEALDCWECFQPPLYYGFVKLIAQTSGFESAESIRNILQTTNFLFSAGILFIILNTISRFNISKNLMYASMLFWSLNPEIISIGALITNDTLLILLGLLAYPFLLKYWHKTSWKLEAMLWIIIATACLIKGNGLVFVVVFGLVVLFKLLKGEYKVRNLGRISLLLATLLLFVAHFGRYYHKHKVNGNAFVINQLKPEPANLITPDTTFNGRKGVTSIAESFLTFRLGSLIAEPYNSNEQFNYPKHRTSFFTQLYGQFSNYFFENHPRSWHSNNNDVKNLVRINYILILPLFLLFVFYLIKWTLQSFKFVKTETTFNLILIWVFLAFTIRYSIIYRDFSNMKLLFMFPALLAIIRIFNRAISKVNLGKSIAILMNIVSTLYFINFIYLIRQLLK
jgi:hypothetical protein